MRILWILNQPLPVVAKQLGMKIGNGGTWIIELSKQVAEVNDLAVVCPISTNAQYCEGEISRIKYFAIPLDKLNVKFEQKQVVCFEEIIKKFKPEIIHIWGTEYVHTYVAMLACKNLNLLNRTVISIQGLVSVYERHFYGYIEKKQIHETVKDYILGWGMREQCLSFKNRGKLEIESIKLAKNVIGRTDWDRACTTQINPNVRYHFCNETLRNSFYEKQWNLEKCEKHSLFVSQSQYPIKGLHHALEALAIIIKKWPDAHLYTTGRDIMVDNVKEKMLDNGYEKYLKKIIKKYHLEKNVTFLSRLEEKEICERFCKSHVFVSCSSIENSSNSVGEAMLLGVPVVASDVGGIKNLLKHGDEGFIYPADEPYMLAYYVSKIFEDSGLADVLSKNAKVHAKKTHDRKLNLVRLLEIYDDIKVGKEIEDR